MESPRIQEENRLTPTPANKHRGFLIWWLAVFLIAQSFVPLLAQRALLTQGTKTAMDRAGLAGLRLWVGALLLLPFAFRTRKQSDIPLPKARYAVFGLLAYTTAHGLNFIGLGLKEANPAHQAFIESVTVGGILLWLAVTSRQLRWRVRLCVVAVATGAVAFVLADKETTDRAFKMEHVLWFASALASVTALLLTRRLFKGEAGLPAATRKVSFSALWGGSVLLLGWLLAGSLPEAELHQPKPATLIWVVLLALTGTCVGWLALFLVTERDPLLALAGVMSSPVLTSLHQLWIQRIWPPISPDKPFVMEWTHWASLIVVAAAVVMLACFSHETNAVPPKSTRERNADSGDILLR